MFKQPDWKLNEQINELTVQTANSVRGYFTTLPETISAALKKLTDNIGSEEGDHNGPFDQIEAFIVNYAGKFTTGNFDDKVRTCIDDILKKEPIRGWLDSYVNNETNKKYFAKSHMRTTGSDGLMDTIKTAIMATLGDDIGSADIVAAKSIEDHVNAVYTCIDKFAVKLESQLKSKISKAMSEIETRILTKSENYPLTERQYLSEAVSATLHQLVGRARQAAKALESFALNDTMQNSKLADNIGKAINAVKALSSTLEKDLTPARAGEISGETLGNQIQNQLINAATTGQFETELGKLLQKTANAALEKLQEKVTAILGVEIRGIASPLRTVKTSLAEVEEALKQLQTKIATGVPGGVVGGNSELMKSATELHNRIQIFLSEKVGAGAHPAVGSLYSDMQNLQKSIKDLGVQVNKVMEKVEKVQSELASCITKAEHLLSEAPKDIEKCFKGLRIAVTKKIDAVFKEIQQKSKDLYTKRKTQEVAALQKIVNDQFTEIDAIIKFDKDLGLKGYLSKLQNKFMPPLDVFTQTLSPPQLPEKKLSDLAPKVKQGFSDFSKALLDQPDLLPLTGRVNAIFSALDTLFTSLTRYDHTFTKNLAKVKSEIEDFARQTYANTAQKVSLSLVPGLSAFVKELEKAYVRVYDGAVNNVDVNKLVTNHKQVVDSNGTRWKYDLTEDGRKLAKVLLTLLYKLCNDLPILKKYCSKICAFEQINTTTTLGEFFTDNGYKVSTRDMQNGELQDKGSMRGQEIFGRLKNVISGATDIEHLKSCESNIKVGTNVPKKTDKFDVVDRLACLLTHLEQYCDVCHMTLNARTRTPCSVFEMLCWFSGLPYTRVYSQMRDIKIPEIIDELNTNENNKANSDVIELEADGADAADFKVSVSWVNPASKSLDAYPNNVIHGKVHTALDLLCAKSYDVLCTIAGTGDAYTMYGVEFNNNTLKLQYPSDPAACLDLLLAILRNLWPVVHFLHRQCGTQPEYYGWSKCTYGNGIQASCWQCGKHSSVHPSPDHTCSGTSPLHLYLTDGLKGMLPHQVTSVGCSSKCNTCPKNPPGMPCITPLGFTTFAGSTKLGKDLCNVLGKLLSNVHTTALFSLVPRPPSTLPEHFGFVCALVNACYDTNVRGNRDIKQSVESSIADKSISLYNQPSEITEALRNVYGATKTGHRSDQHNADQSDLSTLTRNETCSGLDVRCAPYLYSLSSDAYKYVANQHADLYLSWSVYLPWNFWNYLNRLLDAFQSIDCKAYGCSGFSTIPGKHGIDHNCKCKAFTRCRGVLPTLYQHGFTFGNSKTLLDGATRRFCNEFRTQLHNVLKSNYFKLLFTKCDEFLFTIRFPFIWLNVALWLLSLLYLIHIMLIRLDLLHIKSHLHSPSSHRIAAQSLLAAGRVNKLNRVFYLQP